MPKFLENRLKAEYPDNPHAVYGTMNTTGAMHGNKETAKGRAMEAKHTRDVKAGKAHDAPGTLGAMARQHPHRNLKGYLHPKKGT